LKYYIYISDTKVDMLFPQVPHQIQKTVATEYGIDLKVLKATRKSEAHIEENRITRLEAVVRHIREHGQVGPVDEPAQYISEADMPLHFAEIRDRYIYFYGETAKTLIGLFGSAKHLLGATPNERLIGDSSLLLAALKGLKSVENEEDWPEDMTGLGAALVAEYRPLIRTPPEKMEFLAKRLMSEPDPRRHRQVLLATPLYVAKVD
jgi:hypothetical protein